MRSLTESEISHVSGGIVFQPSPLLEGLFAFLVVGVPVVGATAAGLLIGVALDAIGVGASYPRFHDSLVGLGVGMGAFLLFAK